jgi:hypothetical protein
MNVEMQNEDFSESRHNIYSSVAWNLFWFGFLLYTIGSAFPGIPGIYISLKYFQLIQIVGIIFFLPSAIFLVKWQIESVYLRIVFAFYILWSLVTIARGFSFNMYILKSQLFYAPFSIFLYFVPFVFLFKDGLHNLKKIFPVITILSIVLLFYAFLVRELLINGSANDNRLATGVTEQLIHFLSLPSAYILLTYKYQKKRRLIFAILIMLLTFVIVAVRARRGLMFMTMCFLLFAYILYYFTNVGRIFKVISSVVVLGMVVFYGYYTYSKNKSGTFNLISERMDEDTRTSVEVAFHNNMGTRDWVIGRGLNGKYYCPGYSTYESDFMIYRYEIETGYLQIILKGGLISLILYLLITVPAIFIGIFSSKNSLVKASAIWIFLYTLFLYPTYVNMFSLTYIIIWLSVGICYSKSIREKTDEEIKELLS